MTSGDSLAYLGTLVLVAFCLYCWPEPTLIVLAFIAFFYFLVVVA